jgi:hypothetical protein
MALTDMLRRRIKSRKNDTEDDNNDLPSTLSKQSHASPEGDSERSHLSEAENLEAADSETEDSDDDHSTVWNPPYRSQHMLKMAPVF